MTRAIDRLPFGYRIMPALTLAVLLGPVLGGLAGTLLPAFGFLPALGASDVSVRPFDDLLATPGLLTSVRLSVSVGFVTTLASFATVILFCAAWHGTRFFRAIQRLLSPLLSVPHAAVAFGLAFLLAPSGWVARALSPWATGWERPPDLLIINDPAGLGLMAGLVAKEVPFLFLMVLSALSQIDQERSMTVARTLGYGRMVGWLKVVLPRLYPQVRLPLFAVLAYGLSVVDVALILGPTTPPPLAVQILTWANDPDLSLRFKASAAAVLLLGLVGVGILIWVLAERLVAAVGKWWIVQGARWPHDAVARWFAAVPMALCAAAVLGSILVLVVWSFAGNWRFPEFLPRAWSLRAWDREIGALVEPVMVTVVVAGAACLVALVLSIGCLEREARVGRRPTDQALWLLYLPLLVPQVAFLFGVQIILLMVGADRSWAALIWVHLVFVLPYVFLALSDPYRAWDERYGRTALCLGATPARVLLTVKLPMLLRALLAAVAVGAAVSMGQYLPTLLVGGGRFETVTTEAVALASGADRRAIGAWALVQTALPLTVFAAALVIPAVVYRNRRALRVT